MSKNDTGDSNVAVGTRALPKILMEILTPPLEKDL